MNCRFCGAEMPPGAVVCPACRQPQGVPPPPPFGDPFDRILAETRRTAHELADATEKLSRRAAAEARRAADYPSAAAHRAIKRFQKEIEQAKRELDKALSEFE